MSRFLQYRSLSFRIWTSFPTTMARTQETDASTRLGGAQHLHAAGTNRGSRRVERQHRRVAPQALERVVEAGVLEKHVHQHVAVVEKNPSALGDAFGVQDVHSFALQVAADGLGDRLEMGRGLAATDQKIVRDARHALDVEHDEVARPLVQRRARRATRRGVRHVSMSRNVSDPTIRNRSSRGMRRASSVSTVYEGPARRNSRSETTNFG